MTYSALWYLAATSAQNRFRSQVRRLRNPRYFIALLLGAAYFWFILIGPAGRSGTGAPLEFLTNDLIRDLIGVAVFALMATAWIFGRNTGALAFTPAEVHFLFPAPISRRALIVFKLFRLQIATLFGTLIWVLLIRRGGGELHPLARALGFWSFFAILSMHRLGAALVFNSVAQHGVSGLRRQRLVTVAVFAVLAAVATAAWLSWSHVAATTDVMAQGGLETLSQILQQPFLYAVMTPFRLIATAAFAHDAQSWLSAIPFSLAVLFAHFVWVLSANSAFEEAAADASVRVAKRLENFRKRGLHSTTHSASAAMVRRTRLPLAATGSPFLAIVWKNALGFLRALSGTTVLLVTIGLALVLVAVLQGARHEFVRSGVFAIIGSLVFWSIVFGPRLMRNDLRADLGHLPMLKTYPVSGARIVAAEIASATAALSVVQLLFAVVVIAAVFVDLGPRMSVVEKGTLVTAVPIVIITLNALNLTIQNGAALMFPAWTSFGMHRPGGVEVLGQGMLTTMGMLLLLILALVPAGVVFAAAFLLLSQLSPLMRVMVPGGFAILVLVVEITVLLLLLGRVFERTEPSQLN